jgi:hypothetical protein
MYKHLSKVNKNKEISTGRKRQKNVSAKNTNTKKRELEGADWIKLALNNEPIQGFREHVDEILFHKRRKI